MHKFCGGVKVVDEYRGNKKVAVGARGSAATASKGQYP